MDTLLFGRKEFALNLESIIKTLGENENVIAINSDFGTGKTHFAETFKNHFEQVDKGHKFLLYNAWKNDYMNEPLASISSLIKEEIKEGDVKELSKNIANLSWKLAKQATPLIITSLIRKYIGLDLKEMDIKNTDIDKIMEAFINEEIKSYEEKKDLISKLKDNLKNFKEKLLGKSSNRKIIFMIDELDRCRPDFALKLLEIIKHFFDIDGFVFILFINEKHINSMIGRNYGEDVRGEGYLRKFFDYEFKLPELRLNEYLEVKYKSGNEVDYNLKLSIGDSERKFCLKLEYMYSLFLNIIKGRYNDLSIREFDHLDKKFRLILRTFREEFNFSYSICFPLYFCFIEIKKRQKLDAEKELKWYNFFDCQLPDEIFFYRKKLKKTKEFLEYFISDKRNTVSNDYININTRKINDEIKINNGRFSSYEKVEEWCKEKMKLIDLLEK